jgi:hypothetical protein
MPRELRSYFLAGRQVISTTKTLVTDQARLTGCCNRPFSVQRLCSLVAFATLPESLGHVLLAMRGILLAKDTFLYQSIRFERPQGR